MEEWIEYLNSLKESHPSFHGFVIDDFWYKVNEDEEKDSQQLEDKNDQKVEGNVEFMIDSELGKTIQSKRRDLYFYLIIYFEGIEYQKI